jgi:DNA-binding MarR family transcriptional regulator
VTSDDLSDLAVEFVVAAARLTRYASRHVSAMPHAAMRLLGRLDELGPTRISDLAKADRCAQPTMTTLVQRQEEQGWVRREPDPSDSRASLISLTPAGRRELDRARREAGTAIADRLALLEDDDVRRLRDALHAMRAVLHPHADPHEEPRDEADEAQEETAR